MARLAALRTWLGRIDEQIAALALGLMMLIPLTMLTALVYFAEHWVIDGLVGWALVGVSFLVWNRIERRQRVRRAQQARNALEG